MPYEFSKNVKFYNTNGKKYLIEIFDLNIHNFYNFMIFINSSLNQISTELHIFVNCLWHIQMSCQNNIQFKIWVDQMLNWQIPFVNQTRWVVISPWAHLLKSWFGKSLCWFMMWYRNALNLASTTSPSLGEVEVTDQ